jgi:hypothetical protein
VWRSARYRPTRRTPAASPSAADAVIRQQQPQIRLVGVAVAVEIAVAVDAVRSKQPAEVRLVDAAVAVQVAGNRRGNERGDDAVGVVGDIPFAVEREVALDEALVVLEEARAPLRRIVSSFGESMHCPAHV